MNEKNPVMLLFPLDKARQFGQKYLFIGRALSKIIFSLEYDLQKAEINIEKEKYALASLISAAIYGIIFLFIGLAFGVVLTRGLTNTVFILMGVFSFFGFIAALIFHLFYPKIQANSIASQVDQELLFAMRTMLIQLSSGISLFEAIRSISRSDYGQVSREFEDVVRDINSGRSETAALEKLAFKTNSEILKKTIWQILTTIKSGGSIVSAINSQIDELVNLQKNSIKNYAAALNLWTLVYLIVAAALPSLGVTFLVIASSIGSSGIGKEAVILIAILAITTQAGLIFVIKSQVPKVIK
ncbi:MAG: type II secretion system F family protein [archaeon]|jgi:flagellar protein FlaJ